MLGLIVGLFIEYYYFNYTYNDTYLKNVSIFAIANFLVSIISNAFSGNSLNILSSLISSIILALIFVKIMEFVRPRTNSLFIFIIVSELLYLLLTFVIAFCLAFLLIF